MVAGRGIMSEITIRQRHLLKALLVGLHSKWRDVVPFGYILDRSSSVELRSRRRDTPTTVTHLERTLRMCVKMAAMVRALPGGLALQAVGSRCSIRIWLVRSLAAKIWTAARPS